MKNSVMMLLAAIVASAALPALAGQDNLLATFSTKGPDRYADGTVVKDGECYALVWTAKGATFAGITIDGKAAGDQNLNRVLCVAPLANDGRCPDVVVEVNKLVADLYAGAGTFSLHLLDTRRADGTPGGVEAGVNGYGTAQAFSLAAKSIADGLQAGVATNAALAATATELPASIPQPKVKSIEVKDGIVRLTVARTSKLVRYGVSSGTTPVALAADADFAPQDGNDAGDIVITAPAKGPAGFYSIGRAPLK
ncbi:MAG: hypothetical protein II649_05270 [Kiritimatiellae bacterium]|nr:hypothetical protein [Kiritimatiellia bacterium]